MTHPPKLVTDHKYMILDICILSYSHKSFELHQLLDNPPPAATHANNFFHNIIIFKPDKQNRQGERAMHGIISIYVTRSAT